MTDTDLKATFWDRVENVNVGMLSADGTNPRPMAHHAHRDDGALWFLTADHTDIGKDAAAGKSARYQIASGDAKIYAFVDGTLSVETDRAKLEEIWSPMDAAWFEDGKDDPDVRLVRFTPKTAEVWASDGTAKALYDMATSAMGGDTASPGTHGKITF
ncbi:general stress protein [Pelagivirga sediminicola]|uniref:General stress protein n=1 Tax=Pelagivirga sediminicola TaxID=2170575 RepID=A0A2T7GBT7_9RHOB|nr:pyridoxamine 5'-phosphate oxidase family protein [Pelagivirga sediminicola]PVA11879.1 general stress protein [Pelagivirga sediminicola]